MAGLPPWAPPAANTSTAPIGHNGPPQDHQPDPLADLSPWQIYIDCILISDEDTYNKIMLLCIARFMDKQLRCGSSMSYSQGANDCGFSEPTAKRVGKKVRGVGDKSRRRWLRVEVGKGRYVPGKGSENLYHGIIPPDLRDELRRRKAGVSGGYPETIGEVSQGHPETDFGVSGRYPESVRGMPQIQAGYLGDTLTPLTPQSKKDIGQEVSPSSQPAQPEKGQGSRPSERTPRGRAPAAHVFDGQPTTVEQAFDVLWAAYPLGRKRDRGGALDTFKEIVTGKHRKRSKATVQEIVDGARRYAASHPDPKYVPLPTNWLNGGRWADDVAGSGDDAAVQAQSDLEDAVRQVRVEEARGWRG